MARPEPLRVLEEADLLVTAAIAGKWPLARIETEWHKFILNMERRYEPEKFARPFPPVVYTVREIKDLDETKQDLGKDGQQSSDAAPSVR